MTQKKRASKSRIYAFRYTLSVIIAGFWENVKVVFQKFSTNFGNKIFCRRSIKWLLRIRSACIMEIRKACMRHKEGVIFDGRIPYDQ